MGDFLEVLDFSRSGLTPVGAQGGGFLHDAVASDETVFICGGNGKLFSSEGIVMPVAEDGEEDKKDKTNSKTCSSGGIVRPLAAGALQVQAAEEEKDDKTDVKLRLLHKWEEGMDADDETTSDEEESDGCLSSDEFDSVPESPKKEMEEEQNDDDKEEETFIQVEADQKPQIRLSKLQQCSLPGCIKTATLKGLCVAHGGSKRCEHPGCTKKALRSGKCFCHGGGSKCSLQGCTKQALIKGMCVAHSVNVALKGQQDGKGLSVKHHGRKFSGFSNGMSGSEARDVGEGAKCARPRCINAAIDQGLCIDHGGYVPCSVSGCVTRARVKDKCLAHAYRRSGCAKQAAVGERYNGYGGRARC